MTEDCILIIEPEILIRKPLADYLRECGFRVIEAVSLAEAKKLVEAAEISFDAVLADAGSMMAESLAFSSWMRREYPDIEVILAGTVTKVLQEAGELCEEGPALAKPYEHRLVLDRIRQALAARKRRHGGG